MNTRRRHSYFQYCIFMLLLLLLAQSAIAQQAELRGEAVAYRHADLDASFAAYQVYQMDAAVLHRLVSKQPRTEFALELEGQRWPLVLDHHDIRGPRYREVALTEGGPRVMPSRPNITYKGFQGLQRSPVRMTITPEYFVAMIEDESKLFFVEPLRKSVPDAPSDYYLFYLAEDVLTDPEVHCSYQALKERAPDGHDHDDDQRVVMMGCMEVELATAGDFLMFQKYGSVAATNDFILTVTNMMEPLYDDFDLNYLIVDQFVPTSAAADPWTNSDEAFDILDDFSAWAPVNFLTHDVGQIWTDRNIQGCGGGPDNFGLVGCAQKIGDVCGAERYNVCEDFSNSMNCLRVLSAHELGHTWDGVHSEATSSSIMNGTIQCAATAWAAGNITRVQNHIDSRGCLSNCGDLCDISISSTSVVGEDCPNADDGQITVAATTSNGPVTYEIDGPVVGANGSGVFSNLPPGNYTVRAIDAAYNGTCFDETQLTVTAGVDNQNPVPVCLNPTVYLNAAGTYSLSGAEVFDQLSSTDNCGPVTLLNFSPSSVSCAQAGTTVNVTVNVRDVNNNMASCQAMVSVVDDISPTAVCRTKTVFLMPDGTYDLQEADVFNAGLSFDNCSISSVDFPATTYTCDDENMTFEVTVRAYDPSGNFGECKALITVEQGTDLPAPWSKISLGSSSGDATYAPCDNDGEFTLTSNGRLFPMTSDNYQYVHQTRCGGVSITAKITQFAPNGWQGLFIRNGTGNADAGLVFRVQGNSMTTPSSLAQAHIRQTNGGNLELSQFNAFAQPYWLRLVSTPLWYGGRLVQLFASPNGINWAQVQARYVSGLNNCVEVGLALQSQQFGVTVESKFAYVEVGMPMMLQGPSNPTVAQQPVARTAQVFPNPATSTVAVSFSQPLETDAPYLLRNQMGQVVLRGTLNAGDFSTELNVADLAAGVYTIEVLTGSLGHKTLRFVKQ